MAAVSGYSAAAMDREMVYVPGGEFLYGMICEQKRRAAADAGVHLDQLRDHSNRRTLEVPGFWIDRYPVTRGQFARFLKETGHEIIFFIGTAAELAKRLAASVE